MRENIVRKYKGYKELYERKYSPWVFLQHN